MSLSKSINEHFPTKTPEKSQQDIELAIENAYNSGNPIMRSINKDGSKPSVEEFWAFVLTPLKPL